MNEQDTQDIIKRFSDLLHSREIVSAERWADIGGDLQILMYRTNVERLAKEIIAKKKLKELRSSFPSNIDAKTEWETTDEWAEWQKTEGVFEGLKGFKSTANNESNVRKNNNF